jgi:hypothetical protein
MQSFSSCAYQCALTSEATVETFNSRVSYCFPLRNEEHKTVFVVELTTNGMAYYTYDLTKINFLIFN